MEIKKVSIIGLGALGIMYANFISPKIPEGSLRVYIIRQYTQLDQ